MSTTTPPRVAWMTPKQFWRCGYRWGYDDGRRNRPHMLDKDVSEVDGHIIPVRPAKDRGDQNTPLPTP